MIDPWTPDTAASDVSASDPWAPLHHEDAPEPKKPAKPRDDDAAPKAADPPDSTRMMASLTVTSPMDLQLAVPKQLIEDISALAAAQRELGEQVASLVNSLNAWTGDVQASMQSAQLPVIAAMHAAQKSVAEGQRVLAEQVRKLTEAQPDMAKNIATWSQTIEAAIRAPRRVALERGEDGLATGAVSTVVPAAATKTTQPPALRTIP